MMFNTCTKCNIEKPIEDFGVYKKRGKMKIFHRCKECERARSKEHNRTKEGLIARIYSNQKQTSKKRGYTPPSYTKDELKEWLYNQTLFHELYNKWKSSGYNRWKVPSCDRIDEYKGYSLSNIELKTWKENNERSHIDLTKGQGKSGEQCKKVLQFEFTREWSKSTNSYIYYKTKLVGEFYSTKDAENKTGCRRKDISDCATGRRKSALNYIWEYI